VREVYHDGRKLAVDNSGRVLSEQRLADSDPNLPELDYDLFASSAFQHQRLASVLDAHSASLCVWYVCMYVFMYLFITYLPPTS
jgi:hypothetical protein